MPLLTCCITILHQHMAVLPHASAHTHLPQVSAASLAIPDSVFFRPRIGLPFRTGSRYEVFPKISLLPGHNDSNPLIVLTMFE